MKEKRKNIIFYIDKISLNKIRSIDLKIMFNINLSA